MKMFKRKVPQKKGIVLIVIVLTVLVTSVYLASFIMRNVYDLKILHRDKNISLAKIAAGAGLERAFLYLDDDFKRSGDWSDGDIAGISVGVPSPCNATQYSFINGTLGKGYYNVTIQYVCDGSTPRKDRLWVYSQGTVGNITPPGLRRLAIAGRFYNVNQTRVYPDLSSAIDSANPGDVLRIAGGDLVENVVINKSLTIELGYDFDLIHRDPEVYKSIIIPQNSSNYTLYITGGNITLGGGVVE